MEWMVVAKGIVVVECGAGIGDRKRHLAPITRGRGMRPEVASSKNPPLTKGKKGKERVNNRGPEGNMEAEKYPREIVNRAMRGRTFFLRKGGGKGEGRGYVESYQNPCPRLRENKHSPSPRNLPKTIRVKPEVEKARGGR